LAKFASKAFDAFMKFGVGEKHDWIGVEAEQGVQERSIGDMATLFQLVADPQDAVDFHADLLCAHPEMLVACEKDGVIVPFGKRHAQAVVQ